MAFAIRSYVHAQAMCTRYSLSPPPPPHLGTRLYYEQAEHLPPRVECGFLLVASEGIVMFSLCHRYRIAMVVSNQIKCNLRPRLVVFKVKVPHFFTEDEVTTEVCD